jgi:DNA-binding transcriptional LysR family regulator
VGTAVGLVAAGLGLAVLPAYALARARVSGIAAVPLTEPVVHRDIVSLVPSGRSLSGAGEAFLAYLRQSLTEEAVPRAPSRGKRSRG